MSSGSVQTSSLSIETEAEAEVDGDDHVFFCRSPARSSQRVGLNCAFVSQEALRQLSQHELCAQRLLGGKVRDGVLCGPTQAALRTVMRTLLLCTAHCEPRLHDVLSSLSHTHTHRDTQTDAHAISPSRTAHRDALSLCNALLGEEEDSLSLLRLRPSSAQRLLEMRSYAWTRWHNSWDDPHCGVLERTRALLWEQARPESEETHHDDLSLCDEDHVSVCEDVCESERDEGMRKARLALGVLLDDVRCWGASRVFDAFFVLFERADGTVLVSEDFERVFLVVDLEARLSLRCRLREALSPETEIAHYLYRRESLRFSEYAAPGAIVGYKARLTLLPFQDMIVTDGAVYDCIPLDEQQMRDALQAFRLAVEDEKVLVSLPRAAPQPSSLNFTSVVDRWDVDEWLQSSAGQQILRLNRLPLRDSLQWDFNVLWSHEERRFFPVLNTFETYSITIHEDIASAEVYLRALCGACEMLESRPREVSFRGEKETFVLLQRVLREIAVEMFFFDLYTSSEEHFLLSRAEGNY